MRFALFLILSMLAAALPNFDSYAIGDRYVVIICGSGGEEEYEKKFSDWGNRTASACENWLGASEETVVCLQEESQIEGRTTTLDNIKNAFESLSEKASPDDELFVFLIGHGSFVRNQSKFLIPGPDLTAEELKNLISKIPVRTQVVLNGASSSAGFINVLSGPNRIVCTATKSADEQNAAEFMEFFLQGLERNLADLDRDQRITFLDACRYASDATLQWYQENGFIATEHALIDGNGDGLGERLASDGAADESTNANHADSVGAPASRLILIDRSFPKSAPKERINAYLSFLNQIELLKNEKNDLGEETYYQQLETLLIQAASIHREILEYSIDPEPEPN